MEPLLVLIPGMAADERLFEPLALPFGTPWPVRWRVVPGARTLRDYAEDLAAQLPTRAGQTTWYIGSSMGGMLACELHAIRPADELVLLSAPACRSEFSPTMRALGRLRTGRWFTPDGLMRINRLSDTFMGFKSQEDRSWFYANLETYGPDFLHFAVNAILSWDRRERPSRYLQIVGDRDRLFRHHRMHRPTVIPGSGHFLTLEQPDRLRALLHHHYTRS
jgi:pimeloyl-ACP methyl ester carboxylesterase